VARKNRVAENPSQVIDINEVIDEKRARRSFVTTRRFVITVAVIILAVFAFISVREIQDLKKDSEASKAELALKQEQKANLESELAGMDDPSYIEKQARERLRMVKPGEIIYIYKASESPEENAV
jgi:cell division protein FtsB